MTAEREPEAAIDAVRAELQRLGYLTHGLERMLLQDALRSRTPVRAALRLALRAGALGGPLVALPVALGLAAANGTFAQSPFDLLGLFLHLLPPMAALVALGFLGLAGVDVAVARARRGRGSQAWTAWLALAGAGALAVGLGWEARDLARAAPAWQLAVLGGAGALAAAVLWRVLRSGLLALALRAAEPRLSEAFAPRTWLALGVAAAAFLVALPLVALLRTGGPPAAPGNLPTAPGERVVLIGVDGVLPSELDYLLQHGDLPALARLAASGLSAVYTRADEAPAAFWTTVATGVPSAVHGVTSLDSFRPRGVRVPLARVGPLRAFFERVEMPLRLAEYRPVLSSRRSAFTVWELAARGGAPGLAVDWWGTYPAERQPGLVVAHGAYQLLAERAAGAVAASEGAVEGAVARLRAQPREPSAKSTLLAALPAGEAARLLDLAFRPDGFYLDVFVRGVDGALGLDDDVGHLDPPRAAGLYLPGLDIAAASWDGPAVALPDLVRDQLVDLDGALRRLALERFAGTVALVFDPGRRGGRVGRVVLWRPSGCAGQAEIAPGEVAAALFRALGLPQSAELPEPPAACTWPAAPARVPTYGERFAPRASGPGGEEYLENLRSLGYL